jgi:hypothetical protein
MAKRRFKPIKATIIIGIPLLIVFLKVFIQYVVAKAGLFDHIGLTLSSIALGQIFPFIVFDTLLIGKVISTSTDYNFTDNKEFIVKYQLALERSPEKIDDLKAITMLIFIACLVLFMVSAFLGANGDYMYSTIFGVVNSVVVWLYLLFA